MAEDCVCTNLLSIYSALSDIASSLRYSNSGIATVNNLALGRINNAVNNLSASIGTLNDVVSKLDDVFKCNNISIACILNNSFLSNGHSNFAYLKTIHDDLNSISLKFSFDNKNIAEIWSLKDLCVSNETVVEAPLSTYVSKGSLDFNDV